MCGIFGSFNFGRLPRRERLEARMFCAQKALRHRGPDDSGVEIFSINSSFDVKSLLVLGHTRLSIIDLTAGGHQPMHSKTKRHSIVFNGEIYNYPELRSELKSLGHTFDTDSDTEVLLAAWESWGVQGLKRLTGMFAFAVYDHLNQSLSLVRDAFGIKPLFYYVDAEGLYFASELPALLCLLDDKPELNLQQAYDYFVFGCYDTSEATFYRNVKHLLPGYSLCIDLNPMRAGSPERWWRPSIQERSDLSFEDAATQLREFFLNNLRMHLRSDVPVGVALSGGIDSSAVVCAIRHLEPNIPIHTFSFVARGSSLNEEKWIDIINERVGAIPHKIVIKPDELGPDLQDIIYTQGEPFGSTTIYAQYRVFKAAKEAGITVILDGQGADEILAGYSGYPESYVRSLIERKSYFRALRFLWEWSRWPGRGLLRAASILSSNAVPGPLKSLTKRLIEKEFVPEWVVADQLKDLGIRTEYPVHVPRDKDTSGRRLVEELRFGLTRSWLSAILRHGDRNSMRWSIENRVPFLTIGLAEFVLSLPESFLISPEGATKHIFRCALRGIVPDVILDRRDKLGFATPEQDWLSNIETLRDKQLPLLESRVPFLSAAAVGTLLQRGNRAQGRFSPNAWRILNFQLWLSAQFK